MASPQVENGYIRIANELWDALCKIRIPGECRQVFDVIIRNTYGFNKKEDRISLSQFEEMTGIKRQNIKRAIDKLISMNMVFIERKTTCVSSFRVNKNYDEWKPLDKRETVIKKDDSHKTPTVIISDETVIKIDDSTVINSDDSILLHNNKRHIQKTARGDSETCTEKQPSFSPKTTRTNTLCSLLISKGIFPTAEKFVGWARSKQKNEDCIAHCLYRVFLARPKAPWAYAQKIIAIENGNFNEAEAMKEARQHQVPREAAKEIVELIFQGTTYSTPAGFQKPPNVRA